MTKTNQTEADRDEMRGIQEDGMALADKMQQAMLGSIEGDYLDDGSRKSILIFAFAIDCLRCNLNLFNTKFHDAYTDSEIKNRMPYGKTVKHITGEN